MKEVIDFIVKNLSIIISVIALIISIINLIYLLMTNKKRFNLTIENYSQGKVDNKDFYFFNVILSNKSRLPIAINEISLVEQEEIYTFIKSPRLLLEGQTTRGKEVLKRKEIYSSKFPLNINGLCSEQFFLVMYGPKDFNSKKVKIIINTSRGKVKRKIINFKKYFIQSDNFFKELKSYN